MNGRDAISVERLKELLHYDPETGVFTWLACRHKRFNGARAGGSDGGGYISIYLVDRSYKAHRLAWLYMHGEWPEGPLDHINGDGTDNRIANLRRADQWQNVHNRRKRASTQDLPIGVSKPRKSLGYVAMIQPPGTTKKVYLGSFDTKEAAGEAYRAASVQMHGEFSIFRRKTADETPRNPLTAKES